MKTLLVAAMMAIASPALAQSATPAGSCCEQEMECCEKGEDGKMRCKMMGHDQMDHGNMDHGQMDHGEMDHGTMNHAEMDHSAHAAPQPQ